MKRNGVKLKAVPDGSPRRLADMKNGWRKGTEEQRMAFLDWVRDGDAPESAGADRILLRDEVA